MKIKSWLIIALLLFPTLSIAEDLSVAKTATSVDDSKPWYVNLDEATEVARSTDRPMMIVFR